MSQTITSIPSNQSSFSHVLALYHKHPITVPYEVAVFFRFADIHKFEITRISVFVFRIFLHDQI